MVICIYIYCGIAPSEALERRKDFHVFDRERHGFNSASVQTNTDDTKVFVKIFFNLHCVITKKLFAEICQIYKLVKKHIIK